MTDPPPEAACGSDHCITCNDDGVPMTVLRLDAAAGLAECADAQGGLSAVETALVAPLQEGDRVLVHAGVAIADLSGEGFA
jgi:hydrogenase maturation factor